MRTIGTKRPRNSPIGDFVAMCSYCGADYLRSRLRRDGAGFLACPDDYGRDAVTLGKIVAQDSARPKRVRPLGDGGNYDHSDDPPATGVPDDEAYTGPPL